MFEEFVGKRVKLIFKDEDTVLVYYGKILQVNTTHILFYNEKFKKEMLLSIPNITKAEEWEK